MSADSHTSNAFVGVHGGRLIFVIVNERAAFDAIGRPVMDHSKKPDGNPVMTKIIEQDGVTLIFQHWLNDGAGVG